VSVDTPPVAVAVDSSAEIAKEYLKKGSKIYLEGRLQTRKWQDQSGQDRYTTEIVGNEMQMLDGKQDGQQAPQQSYQQQQPQGGYQQTPQAMNNGVPPSDPKEDIPFNSVDSRLA